MQQSYEGYNNDVLLFPDMPVNYAGFWERFGAAFLDGLILMIPNFCIQYLAGPIPAFFINLVIVLLYFALQESGNNQATLGKKALGLKISSVSGERLSFAQAIGRHFAKYISAIILGIGYLMMLWDDKKQTLHDKMASAIVTKN